MAITVTGATLTVTLTNATDLELGGHLTWTADDTYDVGASGVSRPRTGYFGTSLIAPLVTGSTSVVTPLLANAGTLALSATGANVVTVATNGVERTRVDYQGYFGIRTNAPNLPLYVAGTGDKTAGTLNVAEFASNDTVGTALGILFRIGGNATAGLRFTSIQSSEDGTGARPLVLQELGSNVLIGTTTDDGSSRLQVAGNVLLSPYASNLVIKAADNNNSSGSTSGSLTIQASTYGSGPGPQTGGDLNLKAGTAFTGGAETAGNVNIYSGGNAYTGGGTLGTINFFTGGLNSTSTQRLKIVNNGNVLVGGTTDGNYRLDVQSSGSAGTLRVYDQTATVGVTRFRLTPGAGQSTIPLVAATTGNALTLGINNTIYASLTSAGVFTIANDSFILTTAKTPSSASDTGTTGQIAWDANYVYIATGSNTWKRAAIATW